MQSKTKFLFILMPFLLFLIIFCTHSSQADWSRYQYLANPYNEWSECSSTIIRWKVYGYEGEDYAWANLEKCDGSNFNQGGTLYIVRKSNNQAIAQTNYSSGGSRVSLTFDPYGGERISWREDYIIRIQSDDGSWKETQPIDVWPVFITSVEALQNNGSRWDSVQVCYGLSDCSYGYHERYLPDDGSGAWRFYIDKKAGYSISLSDDSNATYRSYNDSLYQISIPTTGIDVKVTYEPDAPAIPNLLSINNSDGDRNYTVDWSEVDKAMWYSLQEQFDNGTWVTIYEDSSSNYDATNRQSGQWCYRVRAFNNVGGSNLSNIQCTNVYSSPGNVSSPSIEQAVLGDPTYEVSWPVIDNAVRYELSEQYDSKVNWQVVYDGSETVHMASDQYTGEWCYRVRGFNEVNVPSVWSSIQCVIVAPLAPSMKAIVNKDWQGSYTVSWSSTPTTTEYLLSKRYNNQDWEAVKIQTGTAFVADEQFEGRWCYRAQSIYSDIAGTWSEEVCTAFTYKERGDCNGDNKVDPNDAAAIELEIHDGDGDSLVNTPVGTHNGSPMCDADGDGDIDNDDKCFLIESVHRGTRFASCSELAPTHLRHTYTNGQMLFGSKTDQSLSHLTLSDFLVFDDAGHAQAQLAYQSVLKNVSTLFFQIDYDESVIVFDPATTNNKELFDSIKLLDIPSDLEVFVSHHPTETNGEIFVLIIDLDLPFDTLSNGNLMSFDFLRQNDVSVSVSKVSLNEKTILFGNTQGQAVYGSQNIYLPMILR